LVSLAFLSSQFLITKKGEGRLFPFYLPWDDSKETLVSISRWIGKPAGSLGHVYAGEDGHLYIGGRRIRFLGVNICGGASFPEKDDAEKIAARLAKFGVNIVRFHHMDASWETFNIFDKTFGNTRHLNPEALDRLDYFIAKLKENGVYVDLNLLVSRRFTMADGLPTEVNTADWKDQQVLGFFVDEVEEFEREYAHQLLTHRNPYTGLTYTEDPAVAFVEIVNEQGLIHSWLGGVVDRLPEVFKERLREGWNQHLRAKYSSADNLTRAWGEPSEGPQVELLENGFFEAGTEGWVIETHNGAEASYRITDGPEGQKALEITVSQTGSAGWHVQFNYPGLGVKAEEGYLVSFKARADREVKVSVSLRQAHEPWQGLSNWVEVDLSPEWKEYEVALVASASEDSARLDISNLGAATTTYQFSSFSMKPFKGYGLKEGESLEDSTVQIFTLGEFGGRTVAARRDWVEFLWNLEEQYFVGMYRYLKENLGVKALVVGTIVGCSTPSIMSRLDVVDTHAYWQHPAFPGTPWDPNNWYVVNEPMVNHLDDSTLGWLALKRVYGKPHIVSEYNHPAPNMYDAETVVTLATYAGLQDWDGIFLFDYGSRDNWDSKRIRSYFDIDQHPVKMATMIPAYLIFIRGDVKPAETLATARLDRQREMNFVAMGKATAWNLLDARFLGMSPAAPLMHGTALVVEDGSGPIQSLGPQDVAPLGPLYRSDTAEVIWDASDTDRGVLLINASRTVAIVGFGGGKSFDFGSVSIEPGETLLDDWSVVTLSIVEGEGFTDWDRLLLVAVGYATNTGMRVSAYEGGRVIAVGSADLKEIEQYRGGITCGTSWGGAPTLVEGIQARVKIKTSEAVGVWALDNTGERAEEVPVSVDGDYRTFNIGQRYRTIWYEIAVRE